MNFRSAPFFLATYRFDQSPIFPQPSHPLLFPTDSVMTSCFFFLEFHTSQLSAIIHFLHFRGLHPTAFLSYHHLVPFHTSGEEWPTKDQGVKDCATCAMWHHGKHVELEPQAGESTITVKDLQGGTSSKDQRGLTTYRPFALTSHLMKTLDVLVLNHLHLMVRSSSDSLKFTYQPDIGEDVCLLHQALTFLVRPGSAVRIMVFDLSCASNNI